MPTQCGVGKILLYGVFRFQRVFFPNTLEDPQPLRVLSCIVNTSSPLRDRKRGDPPSKTLC